MTRLLAVPAIDLRDGAVVQLVGGDYAAERVRLPDPSGVARSWRARGFAELHLVDLDAATGRGNNETAVADILAEASRGSHPVQVGGGMGDDRRIADALGAGAARVIVGTTAIEDPDWLRTAAARHPDRIVVAADVDGSEVVTRGWTGRTGQSLPAVLRSFDPLPLAGVLVTAVHVEGRMEGPDLALVADAVAATRHPVQASGGIRSLADLRALADLGVQRAVIGMAFYSGRLDPEAVAKEFGR